MDRSPSLVLPHRPMTAVQGTLINTSHAAHVLPIFLFPSRSRRGISPASHSAGYTYGGRTLPVTLHRDRLCEQSNISMGRTTAAGLKPKNRPAALPACHGAVVPPSCSSQTAVHPFLVSVSQRPTRWNASGRCGQSTPLVWAFFHGTSSHPGKGPQALPLVVQLGRGLHAINQVHPTGAGRRPTQ